MCLLLLLLLLLLVKPEESFFGINGMMSKPEDLTKNKLPL